jgi:FkbM family methyltransferase
VKPREFVFKSAHTVLYKVVIPISIRSGPFDAMLRGLYRKISASTFAVDGFTPPLHVDNLTVFFNPERPSYTVRGLLMGTYEVGTVALLRDIMTGDKTLVDLGANVGYFSLIAAQGISGNGRVFAFEPDPDTFCVLEKNISANNFEQRVAAIATAIADREGTSTFHQYVNDAGSSSLVRRELQVRESIEVHVTTLDVWAASQGWPKIDVIKMDIEGAEVAALAGMHEVSQRNEALKLILEFNADALASASSDHGAFFAALRNLGFTHFSVINEHGLKPISLEREKNRLVRRARWEPINIYCEK